MTFTAGQGPGDGGHAPGERAPGEAWEAADLVVEIVFGAILIWVCTIVYTMAREGG